MRLDIKGMEDIDTTISDRLVTKLSDFMGDEQRKKLFEEVARNNSRSTNDESSSGTSGSDKNIA